MRVPRGTDCVAMLVMDLDGTLIDADQQLGAKNQIALEALRRRRVVRVVATGRSLFAARRVVDEHFPIDYLVFSSGVGTVKWPENQLISRFDLLPTDLLRVTERLQGLRLDFMLQGEVPETHQFCYHRGGARPNPDFDRRIAMVIASAQAVASSSSDALATSSPVRSLIIVWKFNNASRRP